MIFYSIILLPLINSVVIGIFGFKIGSFGTKLSTISFLSLALFFVLNLFFITTKGYFFYISLGSWFSLDYFSVKWGFIFDSLSVNMLLIIYSISVSVHIYSFEYMKQDPHFVRFISTLSLFTFFMSVLVCADNFILLFFGWEGVGICSFLLINFWYTRIIANKAALKAILVNKLGDLSLILGIILTLYSFNSVDFLTLSALSPFFSNQTFFFLGIKFKILNLICFCFLIASVSKSAQVFFHIWLPDAMEGPTPVSALIHAATMVTVGIFFILRTSFFFEYAPSVLNFLIVWGACTAFYSAYIAIFQVDVKKIIAYSTCSQLGYMFSICGLSAYDLSIYHLINHAFFKALLFLSAGALIHNIFFEQDIRRMGGLAKIFPLTFFFFFLGSFALAGLPFFSGFYSKDLIIELFFIKIELYNGVAFWLLLLSALLTIIYSIRLIYFIFFPKLQTSENYFFKTHYSSMQESNKFLLFPLLNLAIGSIFSGYILKDLLAGPGSEYFRHSLLILPNHDLFTQIEHTNWFFNLIPIYCSFLGCMISISFYKHFLLEDWNWSFRILNFSMNKLYFDEIYNIILMNILFPIGQTIIQSFDNGLLELIGPRGLLISVLKLAWFFNKFLDKFLFNYVSMNAFFIWFCLFLLDILI